LLRLIAPLRRRLRALRQSGGGLDIDLEKFFDRVNHDVLMGLIAERVADKRIGLAPVAVPRSA
jgi:hypothetical protein